MKPTYEELVADITALAALCGAAAVVLERTANDTLDGRNMARRLRGVSDTSLAHLKAEWQADAVSEFASRYLGGHEQELAEIYAGKLRRRAEESR